MGRFANAFGPQNPDATYVSHSFPEQTFNLGEVEMNYAVAGGDNRPALLLIPSQTESWWGYESAMPLLAERFQAFAVDLRGQGRSTRTPGRYTLDNMGNDLVRFIDGVIGRPVIVSGLSSGGVLAAWLSAYAKPGQIRGALYEDPPLFSSEVSPACGPSLLAAAPRELPPWLAGLFSAIAGSEPPQNLKEYDPEWGRAFWTGTVAASCDHAKMLSSVKVPILLTHHFRHLEETTGLLIGALSDLQAARVRDLITACGQPVDYRSFPAMGHAMHEQDPQLFNRTLVDWADSLA